LLYIFISSFTRSVVQVQNSFWIPELVACISKKLKIGLVLARNRLRVAATIDFSLTANCNFSFYIWLVSLHIGFWRIMTMTKKCNTKASSKPRKNGSEKVVLQ
jgi:hypothetical protein